MLHASIVSRRAWWKTAIIDVFLLFVPSLNVSHLCSTVPALRLVVCALVLSNRSSFSCPELSLMIEALVLSVLCLEYLGSLWVVQFNLHWQPRSFFSGMLLAPHLTPSWNTRCCVISVPCPVTCPVWLNLPEAWAPARIAHSLIEAIKLPHQVKVIAHWRVDTMTFLFMPLFALNSQHIILLFLDSFPFKIYCINLGKPKSRAPQLGHCI